MKNGDLQIVVCRAMARAAWVCPRCRAEAARRVAGRLKKRTPGRDRLGRGWRAERRRIEALRQKRDLQPDTSNHRVVAIIQRRLKDVRKRLKLSPNAAAEVTGVSRTGIRKFERCDGNGSISTMAFLIFGYRERLDFFFRGVWREYMGLAPG